MASYVFPGGVSTYVPTLHSELIVEFSMNPAAFPIMKYINTRKVDKQRGFYVAMKNDSQGRWINAQDSIWPDGNDAPQLGSYGNDEFTFPQFWAKRYGKVRIYGYLGVEQAGWDIIDQGSRLSAQELVTGRARRIHTTLTTSGNWNGNAASASSLGGGVWSGSTTSTNYIKNSVMQMAINIQKQTYGSIPLKDMFLAMNPNTAKVIATSGEFVNSFIQSPTTINVWLEQEQFMKYGLPESLYGVNVVVDDTVYNSAPPGETASFSYSFPDNYAVMLSKQQAIQPAAGGSFSTFELFTYTDLETYVFNDVKNRRYELQITENVDDSFIVAPQSGYLCTINA